MTVNKVIKTGVVLVCGMFSLNIISFTDSSKKAKVIVRSDLKKRFHKEVERAKQAPHVEAAANVINDEATKAVDDARRVRDEAYAALSDANLFEKGLPKVGLSCEQAARAADLRGKAEAADEAFRMAQEAQKDVYMQVRHIEDQILNNHSSLMDKVKAAPSNVWDFYLHAPSWKLTALRWVGSAGAVVLTYLAWRQFFAAQEEETTA